MAKVFDWREREPMPADLSLSAELWASWPRQETGELIDRYRGALKNDLPWRNLVQQLAALQAEGQELQEACERLFSQFQTDAARPVPPSATSPPPVPAAGKNCVFISHQRADTARGCRVACLADHQSLDYWLDVHNPSLGFANSLPNSDPRKSVLIAAIIELGLLNSTHVIALHTSNSMGSRWVPYELGRAKARKLTSLQCAGWFEKGLNPLSFGDYVQLAVMRHDEGQVARWLQTASKNASSPPSVPCPQHGTVTLQ